ncbi:unnamed protein product, partial [marine sediment metagenome]
MGVTFHLHQFTDFDGAGLAHAPDVVTPQVHQHNVFSALLFI